jgi:CheY-like chemotaxis protein
VGWLAAPPPPPINRLALVRTLEKLGYTVSQAVNGLQVLDLLAREPYDAVLLDIQMPFMSGIEVARRIRSSASGAIDPHTPVIALTAYAMAGDRERFMEAGMDDYLAKPVDHEELRRVLNRLPRRDG